MANTYNIGTGGDFETIEAYKLNGITNGDTLNIISDIADPGITPFGSCNNITITSNLNTKPVILCEGGKTFLIGIPGGSNAGSDIYNSDFSIENLDIKFKESLDDSQKMIEINSLVFDNFRIKDCILNIVNLRSTGGSSTRVDFKNNLFIKVGDGGVTLLDFSFPSTEITSFYVSNNTFIANSSLYAIHLGFTPNTDIKINSFENNIHYLTVDHIHDLDLSIVSGAGLEIDSFRNNIAYGYATGDGNIVWGDLTYINPVDCFDIPTDPLFVDVNNNDFRLQPSSPAIGAGTDGGNIGWDIWTGQPETISKIIGNLGGNVFLTSNKVSLDIPSNSLTTDKTISITESFVTPNNLAKSSLYVFGPSGTNFNKEVDVTFEIEGTVNGNETIYWSDNIEGPYRSIGGNISGNKITGKVKSFSYGFVGTKRDPMAKTNSATIGDHHFFKRMNWK